MNIIIHRYNSICEPDYIDAFTRLGIHVIEDREEMNRKDIPVSERVEHLSELIFHNQPAFVFSINFFPYISMVCEKLGAIYVCVSVDCPVAELYDKQIQNRCNRVFLFDYRQYLEVQKANPECIFHLPLGVNVDRLKEVFGEPDFNQIDYKYDISFVGSLYNEKNPYSRICDRLDAYNRGFLDSLIDAQGMLPGQELLENCITEKQIQAIKACDKAFYQNEYALHSLDRFVAVNDYLSPAVSSRERIDLLNFLSGVLNDPANEGTNKGISKGPNEETSKGPNEGPNERPNEGPNAGPNKGTNITTNKETNQGVGVHLFTRSDCSKLSGIRTHGGVSTLTEMPKIFRESRINLNMTIRSIQMGLPQRIWDVMGAGGFLMTNYQAELPEYFEIGKHIEAYETAEELVEKCHYYLHHEEERLQIAQNGYELVKANHTVLQRVIEMVRIITSQ